MKNFVLALVVFAGLAYALGDFIAFGADHGGWWVIVLPFLLFTVVFGVSCLREIPARTSEAVGWGFLLVLALLSIYIGFRKVSLSDDPETGISRTIAITQIVIAAIYGLLALVLLARSGRSKGRLEHGPPSPHAA